MLHKSGKFLTEYTMLNKSAFTSKMWHSLQHFFHYKSNHC